MKSKRTSRSSLRYQRTFSREDVDQVTPAQRSEIMAKVKSAGNQSTELRLISLFRAQHITGWRRNSVLCGKPDFVFPRIRLALFVDGCFWHGCPKHCRMPNSHRSYWAKKIIRNKARDVQTARVLHRSGWRVLRVWEHEIKNNRLPARLMLAVQQGR